MPKAERVFRTEAIVLRRQDIGEADRLLLLLTPDHGKFRAVAHGTRKPAARKTGHVELFTLVDMLIRRRGEWYVVAQAETKNAFLLLREDLVRNTYANHLAELLDRFTSDQDSSRAELDLLARALGWLCEDLDPRTAARYYEIRLLALAGFAPSLHYCSVGQEPLEPQDQFFSVADGGVICPDHYFEQAHGMPISLTALKVLRHMQTQPWDAIKALHINTPLHLELERLTLAYITYLLEQRLQSVEFLRRLRREEL